MWKVSERGGEAERKGTQSRRHDRASCNVGHWFSTYLRDVPGREGGAAGVFVHQLLPFVEDCFEIIKSPALLASLAF